MQVAADSAVREESRSPISRLMKPGGELGDLQLLGGEAVSGVGNPLSDPFASGPQLMSVRSAPTRRPSASKSAIASERADAPQCYNVESGCSPPNEKSFLARRNGCRFTSCPSAAANNTSASRSWANSGLALVNPATKIGGCASLATSSKSGRTPVNRSEFPLCTPASTRSSTTASA